MPIHIKLRKWIIDWHRDIGYFISVLVIIYCISGIALNHVDDFNPDFIIERDTILIPQKFNLSEFDNQQAKEISSLIHQEKIKIWDKPTRDQIKLYYDNATLHIYIDTRNAIYEKLSKRPIFYQTNLFHRNSIKGWKWVSDIFATLLIIVALTGLFILKEKNKHSIFQRGKWLVIAGTILPLIFFIYFIFFQK